MLPQGGPFSPRFEEIRPHCHGTGNRPTGRGVGTAARQTVTFGGPGDQGGPQLALRVVRAEVDHRCRPCDSCGGAGTVPTRAGDELLAYLRRHLPHQGVNGPRRRSSTK